MVLTRAAMACLSREALEDYTESQDSEFLSKLARLESELSTSHEKIAKLESEINVRLSALESDVAVTEQVNKLLKNQITHLEKNCHASEQYSRRECLEISGVPASVGNADAEK